MPRLFAILMSLVSLSLALGCSGSPVVPGPDSALNGSVPQLAAEAAYTNRYLWGYWNVRWDPGTMKMEAVPVRDSELHLNVRKFLENTMCKTCLVIGENFVNPDGDLDVMIGVIHPLDDPVYTGFDVRGIAIFPGTKYFDEFGMLISSYANGQYTMVGADGYTKLWSPAGYPPGSLRPIFEYSKGTYAYYNSAPITTLNPYVAFYTLPERRTFQVSNHDERHFVIRFPANPGTLEFGYAVDASWAKPSTMTNPNVPDDFPPNANSIEAYRVTCDLTGTLTPKGGSAQALIRVFDWQGAETISSVQLEAPDIFNGKISAAWQLNGPNYSEYKATINMDPTLNTEPGTYPVLVVVEDTQSVPVIGKINAYQVVLTQVHPIVEFESKVDMLNFPVDSAFDSTGGNAYFSPVPLTPKLEVMGMKNDLTTITGFPELMATGGMGFCRGTRQLYVATDMGAGWVNDVTVVNVDTKNLDYTFDIPSLSGNPGSGPLAFTVNENTQEMWVTLYNENQVAVFQANVPTPTITRIDVGTGPTTLTIDQSNYKIMAVSEGNDTLAIIDGFSQTKTATVTLTTPLTSPDPLLPAMVGLAYVPSSDRLYVATLAAGKVDYYNVTGGVYQGTIQLVPQNTEVIVGLVFDPTSGYLCVTGQAPTGGHVYAIDPGTNQKIAEAETSGANASFPCVDGPNHRLFVPDPAGFVDVYKLN